MQMFPCRFPWVSPCLLLFTITLRIFWTSCWFASITIAVTIFPTGITRTLMFSMPLLDHWYLPSLSVFPCYLGCHHFTWFYYFLRLCVISVTHFSKRTLSIRNLLLWYILLITQNLSIPVNKQVNQLIIIFSIIKTVYCQTVVQETVSSYLKSYLLSRPLTHVISKCISKQIHSFGRTWPSWLIKRHIPQRVM